MQQACAALTVFWISIRSVLALLLLEIHVKERVRINALQTLVGWYLMILGFIAHNLSTDVEV